MEEGKSRPGRAQSGQLLDAHITPPVTVNGRVFLGTGDGQVVCLSAENGEVQWTAEIGEPIAFQPAVAKGRIYLSAGNGSLYCLETGDEKDDGWLMWGANAAHYGKPRQLHGSNAEVVHPATWGGVAVVAGGVGLSNDPGAKGPKTGLPSRADGRKNLTILRCSMILLRQPRAAPSSRNHDVDLGCF